MFVVRTSAPRPPAAVAALSPAGCVHRVPVARRLPASRPPQPAPHRVPCLRPSAARGYLQPAAELGHLPRHGHELHVQCALLLNCSRRPKLVPPYLQSCPLLCPPPPGPPCPPVCLACGPSAARVRLQPVPDLGQHLPRHERAIHVSRALLPAPCASPICTHAPCPLHAMWTPRSSPVCPWKAARAYSSCLAPLIHPAHPPCDSAPVGSMQPPCPPPTSCSSAARGRAPPRAFYSAAGMAGAGHREAATPEALATRSRDVRAAAGAVSRTIARATCAWRPHLHRRERGAKKQTSNGCSCLTSVRRADLASVCCV